MDNQENETITGNKPGTEAWAREQGFAFPSAGLLIEFPKHPNFTNLSGVEVAAKLRERPGFSIDAIAEALARLLESLPAKRTPEQVAADQQAEIDANAMRNAMRGAGSFGKSESAMAYAAASVDGPVPVVVETEVAPCRDCAAGICGAYKETTVGHANWLLSLQRMALTDLAAELSEEGALKWRGLCEKAYGVLSGTVDFISCADCDGIIEEGMRGKCSRCWAQMEDGIALAAELEAALGVKP